MPLQRNQALEFFRSDDLIGLGMEADRFRQSLHPEGAVTYIMDRTVYYTNSCGDSYSVCGIYDLLKREPAIEDGMLDIPAIHDEIAKTIEMGGTGVSLTGGERPGVNLESLERLLRGIRRSFPEIRLHCFSALEILAVARSAALAVRDTIARLRDAGLDSITGSGAEILDDEVRRALPWQTCSAEEWITVHRAAHELGMRTTATMLFGLGESIEQRVNHLEQLRRLQEDTGGFAAFIPSNLLAPASNGLEKATSVEYLKTLAISRLYLDNIENVQCSREAQGFKVLQLGLRFGGNDAGSALEEKHAAEGGKRDCGEEELRRIIREAGFRPVQRDALYRTCFLN